METLIRHSFRELHNSEVMNFDTYTIDIYQCNACQEEFSDPNIALTHLDLCIDFERKFMPKAYTPVTKTIVKRYKSSDVINLDSSNPAIINIIETKKTVIGLVYKKKRLLDRAVSCDKCGNHFSNRHILKSHKYQVHSY